MCAKANGQKVFWHEWNHDVVFIDNEICCTIVSDGCKKFSAPMFDPVNTLFPKVEASSLLHYKNFLSHIYVGYDFYWKSVQPLSSGDLPQACPRSSKSQVQGVSLSFLKFLPEVRETLTRCVILKITQFQ